MALSRCARLRAMRDIIHMRAHDVASMLIACDDAFLKIGSMRVCARRLRRVFRPPVCQRMLHVRYRRCSYAQVRRRRAYKMVRRSRSQYARVSSAQSAAYVRRSAADARRWSQRQPGVVKRATRREGSGAALRGAVTARPARRGVQSSAYPACRRGCRGYKAMPQRFPGANTRARLLRARFRLLAAPPACSARAPRNAARLSRRQTAMRLLPRPRMRRYRCPPRRARRRCSFIALVVALPPRACGDRHTTAAQPRARTATAYVGSAFVVLDCARFARTLPGIR